MRGAGYSVALGALLLSTAVQAQTIDATPVASGVVTESATTVPFAAGRSTLIINGNGGSLESLVEITATHVSFESGVAVSGPFSSATSFSGVDITVTNVSSGPLSIDEFGSTIIPAGLGFYLQDRVGPATDNNIFTGYGQTTSSLGFADLNPLVGVGQPFAYSDFDFSVVSNDVTLYSLSGSLSLSFDGDGNVVQNFNLSDAALALSGFTTAYDNAFALAYAWDATDIVIPLGALLETGESQVIEYRTSVTSFTRSACVGPTTCLVAYSGFGDPIGRGGGVDSVAEAFSAFSLSALDTGTITGIVFDPQLIQPFRFIDGGGNAVPEPATWMTVILGFGLMGAALRRRRVVAYS